MRGFLFLQQLRFTPLARANCGPHGELCNKKKLASA